MRLASGNQRNNYQQLQTLFHKGFISRFALPTVYSTPGEFVYYLDTMSALRLLIERGLIQAGRPEDQQRSHFLYEADRGTEHTSQYKLKLRAHWHFIVKHNLHRPMPYNVHAIRAVLTESTTSKWANKLREAAEENIVSPNPSPLFWFTSSEAFTDLVPNGKRPAPRYLLQPEVVFKRIWHTPVDDTTVHNLAE